MLSDSRLTDSTARSWNQSPLARMRAAMRRPSEVAVALPAVSQAEPGCRSPPPGVSSNKRSAVMRPPSGTQAVPILPRRCRSVPLAGASRIPV